MFPLLVLNVLAQGSWQLIGQSGVVCIHTFMLPDNKLVCLERPHEGIYPPNPNTGSTLATQLDISSGRVTYQPIPIRNNPFCAGHAMRADGSILVAGGDNKTLDDATVVNGRQGLRIFTPCVGNCTGRWEILPDMTTQRWYPTVVTLHTGRQIIIGGSTKNLDMDRLLATDNNPTYEYYPAKEGQWPRQLDILQWAFPHNLYPPAFQTPAGEVMVVVSNRTIMINPETDAIRNLDDMPILDHSPWIYPHTPTAVVLPMTKANNFTFEIMMCGGSKLSTKEASTMCVSIRPDEPNARWRVVDDMPHPRLMPDSVLMPGTPY
jgi:hypothetical protein